METLAEKIKKKHKTPYEQIAEKYNTTRDYVGLVARGYYKAKRGKALKIKQELEKLAS
ncbi:XRE family transcriptional regulator [Capnocytophaga canimorsus]|uniref:XRE family transcriptional regulator n=1 Tax=Capnocytophaga canimorsus TaxID=28188 RepID=UPI0013A56AB8|nr:XRE family transcriptional regulator [Capnocytophaga canimorsus]